MASHLSLSLLLLIFSRLSVVSTGAYRVSVKTGGSSTIPCPYHQEYKTHVKYWCKGDYFNSCSPVVHTYLPKSTTKASISDDINQLTFTVTMTDLGSEDSGHYWCAVVINGLQHVGTNWFHLSVTPGTPELYVDQQEVTGVEGGSVIVNCYYGDIGHMKWCRIGGSVSCVWWNSGTIDGTSVTLQQTTDATRRNILTVTMSGLKMENTGWYSCEVGYFIMPVHITVRRQTTTQSTTTMTTTQAPTTEQSSFSPTAEPVQTDNTVQGPERGKEKDTMSSIDLKVLLIPLGMLVLVIAGVLVTWKMWRKHKDNKAMDQTTNTSLDPFPANGDDVTYSTVVPKRRNQLNVQTKQPKLQPLNNPLSLQLLSLFRLTTQSKVLRGARRRTP
ncbi:polymeric immunoglobulin receptor-like [Coregonus clupeaformis]|uniref:polymeric immunoglobulin receptor-like n=1 Tax=Coregonus clupeaformis TaxID=59861 RepID=UPI001E1C25B2|nr:polymeric immunoglobulin receptor-like [Coregonus clupeaformis]